MPPTVLGYLRSYTRKDGSPGQTLEDQRALVNRIARDLGAGIKRDYWPEAADGAAQGWPFLQYLIQMATDDEGPEVLLVIPTLDGVQFNLSFLEPLAARECEGAPICVRSGWRRGGMLGEDTNYPYRGEYDFWRLSHEEEWSDFSKMVGRVRRREKGLPGAIKAGIEEAKARGVKIGGQREGSYRFTADERSKGSRVSANRRRLAANVPYQEWIAEMRRLQEGGRSAGKIARCLAAQGAGKADGSKIGPMLVSRILKRDSKQRS